MVEEKSYPKQLLSDVIRHVFRQTLHDAPQYLVLPLQHPGLPTVRRRCFRRPTALPSRRLAARPVIQSRVEVICKQGLPLDSQHWPGCNLSNLVP